MSTVSAILLKDNKILTVKRKKEPWKGVYGLPGGHIEKGEDEIGALKRETKEETGFDIEAGKSDFIGIGILKYHSKKYKVSFYKAKIIGGRRKAQKEEIQEIKWFDIEGFIRNLKEYSFSSGELRVISKFIWRAE